MLTRHIPAFQDLLIGGCPSVVCWVGLLGMAGLMDVKVRFLGFGTSHSVKGGLII